MPAPVSKPTPPLVEVATEVTDELVGAFARLIPQLSTSSPPPDAAALAAVVGSEASTVLIARDAAGHIIGTTTLVVFAIPTGVRAVIEDVVVDADVPRQGTGRALTMAAVERAHALGAKTVDLTSRPSREAANAMYQRLGFELRETNCYRHQA